MSSLTDTQLRHWLALNAISGVGAVTFTALLQRFPNLADLFAESATALMALGLSAEQTAAITQPDWRGVDNALAWRDQRSARHILTQNCAAYPFRLKQTIAAPPILFVEGQVSALSLPQLAVVGSRNATHAGLETAFMFAKECAAVGLAITSGLALGVDASAHQGALSAPGVTLAVLGTGIDSVYPRRHHALAKTITEQGALISEFPLGMPPLPQHFPRRNRIVSGLSLGVLVVEASLKSGSLITARYALEQNREVFALPGSIHNPLAQGCHHLLRQGAKLVTCVVDILEELAPQLIPVNVTPARVSARSPPHNLLAAALVKLLECIDYEATSLDSIAQRSEQTAQQTAVQLTELELAGYIRAVSGGYVKL